jgi:protein-S-isoprenylcysteine O-methyltransferase Ste14
VAAAYALVAAGWIIWFLPFALARRREEPAKQVDRRARWGMVLQGIAYAILWQNLFWTRSPQLWQLAISFIFFLLASVLSWSAVRSLGRQWRFDAGLSSDHALITSGPYRTIRHPIYASMLCMLWGTGILFTPVLELLIATVIAIMGTEIRVRTEDKLLASHFGSEFLEYKRRVAAYIPMVR